MQNLRESVDDYKYVGLGWYPANPERFREGVAFLAARTFPNCQGPVWIACEGPKGPHRFVTFWNGSPRSESMNREKVIETVTKVRTLQALTNMTGTITKRSQGLLLQSLTPEELILAAEMLTKDGQNNGNAR